MKTCIARRAAQILQSSMLAGVCFLWAGMLTPLMLHAAPTVAARYAQAGGTQLVIEITLGPNPPASVILVQHFPSGVKMLASQPKASNYNTNKNRAKWLLRNIRPGKSSVSITLDRAVTGSEISGEIRFKPAQGGQMVQSPVEK